MLFSCDMNLFLSFTQYQAKEWRWGCSQSIGIVFKQRMPFIHPWAHYSVLPQTILFYIYIPFSTVVFTVLHTTKTIRPWIHGLPLVFSDVFSSLSFFPIFFTLKQPSFLFLHYTLSFSLFLKFPFTFVLYLSLTYI